MSVPAYDCVGVGLIALDHLLAVDGYPASNTKNKIKEYSKQGGGPVPTALATLGKLGKTSALITKIGQDCAGDFLKKELDQFGVDTKYVLIDATISTPESFIIIDRNNGARTVFLNRPKQACLRIDDVAKAAVQNCSLVHLDGHDCDISLRVAEWAHKVHIPVSLDIGSHRPVAEELLEKVDVAIVSEHFAEGALVPGDPLASCKMLCKYGIKTAGVTCGNHGCYFATNDEHLHQPAFNVAVKDTTGAGDVFHGAALFAILEGFELSKIAQFASAAAALKCRQMGGKSGIPDLAEIMKFLHDKIIIES